MSIAPVLATSPLPLTGDLAERFGTGTVAIFLGLDHPFTQQLIDLETTFFPEAPALFDVTNADVLFKFLVICSEGSVRHVVRISAPAVSGGEGLVPFFVSDLVGTDPDLDMADAVAYYEALDLGLDQLISVETQFRLGDQMEPIRSADLAYMTLFRLVEDQGLRGVVAHLNAPAIKSFARVGMNWHPFAGRVDLRTPTVKEDGSTGFDEDYFPVCIPYDGNEDLLQGLGAAAPDVSWV